MKPDQTTVRPTDEPQAVRASGTSQTHDESTPLQTQQSGDHDGPACAGHSQNEDKDGA